MATTSTHHLLSSSRFGPQPPSFDDRQNVSDRERLGSLVAGAALLGYGLLRRSIPWAALGTYLAYRGHSGRCHLYDALGIDSTGDADGSRTTFLRSVIVNRPRKEVYDFLLSSPPAGSELDLVGEWQDDLLFWSSKKSTGLETQYAVELEDMPGDAGTVMRAWVSYAAPDGRSAGPWSTLAKPFTAQRVEKDLRAVKQLLEAGEIASTKGQASGPSLRRRLTNAIWGTT